MVSSAPSPFGTTTARLLVLLLLALGRADASAAQGFAGGAADDSSPHSEATLVSEAAAIVPGQPFTVALRITMDPHWHSYWLNPGDSGLPTDIAWALPEGFEAGPIQWPYPERVPVDPMMTYAYYDEVLLPVELTPPADLAPGADVTLAGEADWLICEKVCLPASESVALTLPVAEAPASDGVWAERLAAARTKLPADLDGLAATATRSGNTYALTLTPPDGARLAAAMAGAYFFPAEQSVIQHNAEQAVAEVDGAYRVALQRSDYAQGDPERLVGVLVAAEGTTFDGTHRALAIDAPLEAPAPEGVPGTDASDDAALGLLAALGLALVGGLLLNLMPCVFPILSIKILGFARQAGGDPRAARAHGWLFAAGVLVSFWVLAGVLLGLRAGGEALGWGFQLQSPLFVAAMALLFFALALNLMGVFELGLGVQAQAARLDRGEGASGAFFSGVLATLVATPCTAPFTMGPALGWALAQPAAAALAVFTALGAGMALPYVVLTYSPALLERLPRPGPWMELFKQALAFPLVATVVWLAWVFGLQTGVNGLALLLGALVALALAAWLLGRWQHRVGRGRAVAYVLAAVSLVGALVLVGRAAAQEPAAVAAADGTWGAFSAETVAALNAEGRAVFVDFTAAWCITCQVNKQVALRTEAVEDAFARRGVVPLVADWTNRDPAITAALERFGRSGVPLYVLYPPEGEPVLLPEVLTPGIVLSALEGLPASAPAVAAAR